MLFLFQKDLSLIRTEVEEEKSIPHDVVTFGSLKPALLHSFIILNREGLAFLLFFIFDFVKRERSFRSLLIFKSVVVVFSTIDRFRSVDTVICDSRFSRKVFNEA